MIEGCTKVDDYEDRWGGRRSRKVKFTCWD